VGLMLSFMMGQMFLFFILEVVIMYDGLDVIIINGVMEAWKRRRTSFADFVNQT
jgi:hypothetical protein